MSDDGLAQLRTTVLDRIAVATIDELLEVLAAGFYFDAYRSTNPEVLRAALVRRVQHADATELMGLAVAWGDHDRLHRGRPRRREELH